MSWRNGCYIQSATRRRRSWASHQLTYWFHLNLILKKEYLKVVKLHFSLRNGTLAISGTSKTTTLTCRKKLSRWFSTPPIAKILLPLEVKSLWASGRWSWPTTYVNSSTCQIWPPASSPSTDIWTTSLSNGAATARPSASSWSKHSIIFAKWEMRKILSSCLMKPKKKIWRVGWIWTKMKARSKLKTI